MDFTLKPSETGTPPPPTMTCPKCGFQQPEQPDCAKCGIVVARYKPSQAATPAYTPPPPEKSKEQQALDRLREAVPVKEASGLGPLLGMLLRWGIVLGCIGVLFMIFRPAPAPTVTMDPEGAQKAAGKFQAAQEAALQGQSFAMPLTEGELNAWLQANLTPGGAGLTPGQEPTQEQVKSSMKDIKIHLAGDRIQAYTLFNMYGKDVSLQLTGKLQVKDGRLRLDATEGTIGTLPIPKATLGSATSTLFDSPGNREKFMLPPHIADVQIQNGELVISYRGVAR
jgi:hypothetical protein